MGKRFEQALHKRRYPNGQGKCKVFRLTRRVSTERTAVKQNSDQSPPSGMAEINTAGNVSAHRAAGTLVCCVSIS